MAACRSLRASTHEWLSIAFTSQFVSSRRNWSTTPVGASVSLVVTLDDDGEAVALSEGVVSVGFGLERAQPIGMTARMRTQLTTAKERSRIMA
jgi:hypothetical protein